MPKQPIPPPLVEPDEPRCVCISINESWAVLLLGAVHHMQYPEYWAGTLEQNRIARRQAKNLMAVISEAIQMGCCCNDQTTIPRRERYTSTGRMEVSYDGGTTWENGDNFDPRFNSPLWPPLYTQPGQDLKCIAANNAYAVMKDLIDQIQAEQSLTVDRIAVLVTVFLGTIAVLASGGILAGLIAAFGGFILGIGQTALQDMFTSTEWDMIKCILYNNMLEDGSFDTAGWQAVKDQVTQQFEYSPRLIIVNQLNLMGPVGLTNAGRKQTASPDVTCEDCENPGWCYDFDFTTGSHGWEQWLGEGAVYTPGVGWTTVNRQNGGKGLEVIRYFSSSNITEIDVVVVAAGMTGGNVYVGTDPGGYSFNDGMSNGQVIYYRQNIAQDGITSILVNAAAAAADSIVLVEVKILGTGINPFGTDNC